MNIVSIGGGPAGLYTSILLAKRFPDAKIRVFERNRADDTFGWGVVFSDETLGNFEERDPESLKRIKEEFIYWSDIETYFGGECLRSTGHGFCGMSRKRLLNILQERCVELGVELNFETDADYRDFATADLILGADGLHSKVRDDHKEVFEPDLDWRACKFSWLGTNKPLEAFTFHFKANEHGLWRVHAYPFEANLSTWIVECREETLKAAGLEEASEEETVAYCKKLFAEELGGYDLLANRSIWRTFPTVKNRVWHHKNMVLIGDSAHTAHFSIGSGTKLAMEDAIALDDSFAALGPKNIEAVLAHYQETRYVDTIKTQKAAQTSLEWFENTERYVNQDPIQFSFNLMTRSKRITYENLELRDPALVARTRDWFARSQGAESDSQGQLPVPVFVPIKVGKLKLANRLVVSPMCQYSALDGNPGEWHKVHYGSRAIGGAGLLICEATAVAPEGRITYGCTGIYNEDQVQAWSEIVAFAHAHSDTPIGLQIGHAGRKASAHLPWSPKSDQPLDADEDAWPTIGPSARPFAKGWPTPKAMTLDDMATITEQFVSAAQRADRCGFDLLELHMAHGYLLSAFISPLANHRDDDYGGSLANRMRFPLEVLSAVRSVWPANKPLSCRISASDWVGERGIDGDDAAALSVMLEAQGCDLIDVSSGGNSTDGEINYGRMYQVPLAERIKLDVTIPVMAVGAILGPDHANTVIAAGRADLCALARPHLRDPYLARNAAEHYGFPDMAWPNQYLAGRPKYKK